MGAILNRAKMEGVVLYVVCHSGERKHCTVDKSVVKMHGYSAVSFSPNP